MNFTIKNYFLVILGEKDTNRISVMVKRMGEMGKCVAIMPNTYILTIEKEDVVSNRMVRDSIMTDKSFNLIVVSLNGDTRAAWCLKNEKSQYFKSVFEDINE